MKAHLKMLVDVIAQIDFNLGAERLQQVLKEDNQFTATGKVSGSKLEGMEDCLCA